MRILLTILGFLSCVTCPGVRGQTPEAFNKMLDRYRNASSFSCEGSITTGAKGSTVQSEKTFKLSFERPGQLNLEIVDTNQHLPKTNRVFTVGGTAFSQIAASAKPKEEASLYQALRTCRGVSAGMSDSIPALALGTNIFKMDSVVQAPDARMDGTDCLRFNVANTAGQPIELFVDKGNYAILKLQRTFTIAAKQIPANAPDLRALANSKFETTITCRNVVFK